MADTDIIVSEMPSASQINTNDLVMLTQPDVQAETGYSTKKGTTLQIFNKALKGTEYSTDLPSFENKNVLEGMEELKANIEALLPVDTSSGNIASFNTELARPLQSVIVNVTATGGNGSPDSPNPIVGYSSANITRCGVNLYSNIFSEYRKPVNYYIKNMPLKIGTTYTLKATLKSGGVAVTGCYVGIASKGEQYSEFENMMPAIKTDGITSNNTFTPTNTWTSPKLIIYCANEAQFNSLFENYDISLTEGTSDFTPYNGSTVTLAFGQTVYGGVLDVTRGKLKPCIEYPSYNGETLSGRWLSSEATYVEGTTPPTGSQVVSLDDYGTDIDLTPEAISAIVGTNNVFADCGNIEVKFKDTIQHYIDKKIAQTQALIL